MLCRNQSFHFIGKLLSLVYLLAFLPRNASAQNDDKRVDDGIVLSRVILFDSGTYCYELHDSHDLYKSANDVLQRLRVDRTSHLSIVVQEKVPYSMVLDMARQAWGTGVRQVTLSRQMSPDVPSVTLTLLSAQNDEAGLSPEISALQMQQRLESELESSARNGQVLYDPAFSMNTDPHFLKVLSVSRDNTTLKLLVSIKAMPGMWIDKDFFRMNCEGCDYLPAMMEGMSETGDHGYLCPEHGNMTLCLCYDNIPSTATTVDINLKGSDRNVIIRDLQISADAVVDADTGDSFAKGMAILRNSDTNGALDVLLVNRIEHTESNTFVFLTISMDEPGEAEIYLGDDLTLTSNGSEPVRVLDAGVFPTGQTFKSSFYSPAFVRLAFPACAQTSELQLSGTVCSDKISVRIRIK